MTVMTGLRSLSVAASSARYHCLPSTSPASKHAGLALRTYATHTQGTGLGSIPGASNATKRRQITVTSDDGRYSWSELSTKEKAARGTQQTFNFAIVIAGAAGTILVSYFLYTELFASDSRTRQFNHAVDRIKADSRCVDLLGDVRYIKAYGEPTTSKWARARPIASNTTYDNRGVEEFRMHFNVEGPDNSGVVAVHMTKRPQDSELQYETLSLTVPGHQTLYLEQSVGKTTQSSKAFRLFGVNLG